MSAMGLTPRQMDAMRFIAGFREAHGQAPTLPEIGAALGIKRKSGVHRLLSQIEERGHIRRRPYEVRGLDILVSPPIPHAPDGAPLRVVKIPELQA